MKKSITQKAERIIAARDEAIKDFETVCHAGICPICGETLTLHHEVTERIETVGWIFKKEIVKRHTDTIIVCPKGHKLIHPRGHNVSNPGHYMWDDCLNKEISDYHKQHYDGDDDDFGC